MEWCGFLEWFLEWYFGVISEVLLGQKMTFLCLGIPDVNMLGVNTIKPH